jgi:hypothetical protein
MKEYGGVDLYTSQAFLTSALNAGERPASRPGRFTRRVKTAVPFR